MSMKIRICLTASILLAAPPSQAQSNEQAVEEVFRWASPDTPGCAVAVARRGRTIVNRAFGATDLEHDILNTPNTIFEAGSAAKQFTAAAILSLVQDGRLSLTDDVRKYIPELPDYGQEITVDHLLTHTSGLRDWPPLVAAAGAPRLMSVHGNDDVFEFIVRQRGLNHAPGAEFSYTNSGYVLLVRIVERVSGMPFSEFTRKRLFDILAMKSTRWRDDFRTIVKNRAIAYGKDNGDWKQAMPFENAYGGGGLLTTTNDLLIWNEALTSGRLGELVTRKIQENATLSSGRQTLYARGLFVQSYRGVKEIAHGGATAGYRAWLGRYPTEGLSLALLCNNQDVDVVAIAHSIIDPLLTGAEPPSAASVAATAAPTAAALSDKAGLFVDERTGLALRILHDEGRLRVESGQTLIQTGENRFRYAHNELSFVSRDRFIMTSGDGESTAYRRTPAHAPSSSDLRAFEGIYRSDELGVVYEVVAEGNGLVMRLHHSPGYKEELRPVYQDAFKQGPWLIRFHRNKAGQVIAFGFNTGRLRNLLFTRAKS
jgi:CubicO group peptidase (beta-lactamase class C family)